MPKRSTRMALIAVPTLIASLAVPAIANASPTATTATIPHTKPLWISHAKSAGPAAATAAVSARVYLAPTGGMAALTAFAKSVSTPGSANFHKFLTTRQYYARFETTSSTVSKVKSYLTSAGLRVTGVEAHNRYISITGSVAAANRPSAPPSSATATTARTCRRPRRTCGCRRRSPARSLTVPGLDTTLHAEQAGQPRRVRSASPGFSRRRVPQRAAVLDLLRPDPREVPGRLQDAAAEVQGQDAAYAPCGYTGPQFRAAYEGNSALTAPASRWRSPTRTPRRRSPRTPTPTRGNTATAAYAPGQFTQARPGTFSRQADLRPVRLVRRGDARRRGRARHGAGREHPLLRLGQLLRRRLPRRRSARSSTRTSPAGHQLLGRRRGERDGRPTIAAYEQVFLQGAMQGISFLFSSGDNGDELADTGIKQADYPASDPYVTAVGGTSDAIGSHGSLAFQTGWGTHKYVAVADGTVLGAASASCTAPAAARRRCSTSPRYQDGVVAGLGCRQVPDVGDGRATRPPACWSARRRPFPDGTYYGEYRIGGTSLASPLFAGMTALTLQNAGGERRGPAQPDDLRAARHGVHRRRRAARRRRRRAGRLRQRRGRHRRRRSTRSARSTRTRSLKLGKGWDDVTGVGSPNPAG